jgi:hypothetical protein
VKKGINEQFSDVFPYIKVSLSKLRSIKREMQRVGSEVCEGVCECECERYVYPKIVLSLFIFVTFQCDVDVAAIAYSYVYFEKLVLMVSEYMTSYPT